MKNYILLISLFLLFLLFLPLSSIGQSQNLPDSVYETESIVKLGSLLNLKLSDIRFRDDYTDIDSFRLARVAELMENPYGMVAFNEAVRDAANGLSTGSVLKFMYDNLKRENQTRRYELKGDDFVPGFAGISLYYNNIEFNRLLMKVKTGLYERLPEAADSMLVLLDLDEKKFLINQFKDMLTEDTANLEKTAEELDSLQHLEEEYAELFVEFAYKIRKDFLLSAGISFSLALLDELKSLLNELESGNLKIEDILNNTNQIPERSGIASYLGHQERWKIGGLENDYHSGEYDFIFDFGGDDQYDLSYDPENLHSTVIIDLSGNDIYNSKTDFTIGSGCMSAGILIDLLGDDVYNGKSFSVGSGYYGLGIIYDGGGNDKYYGDTHTEGAGTFGIGLLLLDKGGHDYYCSALYSQGFGMTEGFGLIVDRNGNDNYFAGAKYRELLGLAGENPHHLSLSQGFGYGLRPYCSGGIGVIADFKGNDNYLSDIMGTGSSYWWSLGMIYDSSGHDQYVSYQYAQGAGIHMSLGFLLDETGDDFYRGKGLMQGCGHDYGCGFILDRNGNDIYQADDLSQAGGQANGIGILIDNRGNDAYYVLKASNTQGYGNPRRDFGSIGLFIDLSGTDIYSGNGSDNAYWKTGSKWGGGMDVEFFPNDSIDAEDE